MSDERGRILIIDDDQAGVAGLRMYLEDEGFTVHVESSLITVPLVLRRVAPHVILLDLSMPALSGTALLRLKPHARADAAVVLFSGRPSAELAELAREHGADGFVSKTAELAEIVSVLDHLVAQRTEDAGREHRDAHPAVVPHVLVRSDVPGVLGVSLRTANYLVTEVTSDGAMLRALARGAIDAVVLELAGPACVAAASAISGLVEGSIPVLAVTPHPRLVTQATEGLTVISAALGREEITSAVDLLLARSPARRRCLISHRSAPSDHARHLGG